MQHTHTEQQQYKAWLNSEDVGGRVSTIQNWNPTEYTKVGKTGNHRQVEQQQAGRIRTNTRKAGMVGKMQLFTWGGVGSRWVRCSSREGGRRHESETEAGRE